MFYLKLKGSANTIPLIKTSYSIGRSNKCDIVLDSGQISRNHAHLLFVNDRWSVIDWDTPNNTYVNGKEVSRSILASGDILSFNGSQDATFFEDDGLDEEIGLVEYQSETRPGDGQFSERLRVIEDQLKQLDSVDRNVAKELAQINESVVLNYDLLKAMLRRLEQSEAELPKVASDLAGYKRGNHKAGIVVLALIAFTSSAVFVSTVREQDAVRNDIIASVGGALTEWQGSGSISGTILAAALALALRKGEK